MDKLEITSERVLSELAKLAFSNMGDFVEPNEDGTQLVPNFLGLTREQMAAIQEIKVDETGGSGDGKRERVQRTSFKLAAKTPNLELLGKHLKLFTEKIEHSIDDSLAEAIAKARQRVNGV